MGLQVQPERLVPPEDVYKRQYYHFAMVAIHQLELKFSQPVVAISIFSPYSYHNSIIKLKSHSLYQRNI